MLLYEFFNPCRLLILDFCDVTLTLLTRWAFSGLLTNRWEGGQGKKASSLKYVAHILQWWKLVRLYLT